VERWTVRPREGTPRPAVDPHSLLAAVRALDGVTEAALGPDGTGHHSLRLTLADGVDDAAVAARVADLLDGRFGVPVDARRSKLVEYGGPERRSGTTERRIPPGVAVPTVDVESVVEAARVRPSTPYGHPRSVLFERMTVVTSVGEFGAEVVLSTAAGRATGRASGPANDGSALHTVARATLAAMDGILAGVGRCSFEDVQIALVGGRRVVVVAITLLGPGNAERLTGAAPVDEDSRQAVVRACLAALDRRVEGLLGARRSTLEA
jgi:hypothetical protein